MTVHYPSVNTSLHLTWRQSKRKWRNSIGHSN